MKRILVVDDKEINLRVAQAVLREYTIITATNGQEAIARVHENPCFMCILMDIEMPVMNGIDATVIIKKEYPDLKIFCTSTNKDLRHHLFSGYVSKPFSSKILEIQ